MRRVAGAAEQPCCTGHRGAAAHATRDAWESIYRGSRLGTSPGAEKKVDRRPFCYPLPHREHAGLGARVAVGSVPPTGYGPRRTTAHTVRTVGEPVGVVGAAAGGDWGPGLYQRGRQGAAGRHPGPSGGDSRSGSTRSNTGVGRRGDRGGGLPGQHGVGTPLTRLTRGVVVGPVDKERSACKGAPDWHRGADSTDQHDGPGRDRIPPGHGQVGR